MAERLQKLMAQAGLGSRRSCEQLIAAGRVTVNGRVAVLGEKADPGQDRILVDGRPLRVAEELLYIALYKPRGVLSAVSGPDPRRTVRSLVDLPGHLYPVGRLDLDSEGLILMTNDGELANQLTHPKYAHDKEYLVLIARRPDEEQLQTWRRGVVLEDGYRTQPAEVFVDEPFGKGTWLRVILREGRKRQIRETGSKIGLPVVKIIRTRIGSLYLGGLKPGQWRSLTPQEVEELKMPSGRGSAKTGAVRRSADSLQGARAEVAPKSGAAGSGAARPGAAEQRKKPRRRPARKPRTETPSIRRPAAALASGEYPGSHRPSSSPRSKAPEDFSYSDRVRRPGRRSRANNPPGSPGLPDRGRRKPSTVKATPDRQPHRKVRRK